MNGERTPKYLGPTSAERFCDDLAAQRALKRHDLPEPPQLSLSSIVARYPATSVEHDDVNLPYIVSFMDGSSARRNERGWWQP